MSLEPKFQGGEYIKAKKLPTTNKLKAIKITARLTVIIGVRRAVATLRLSIRMITIRKLNDLVGDKVTDAVTDAFHGDYDDEDNYHEIYDNNDDDDDGNNDAYVDDDDEVDDVESEDYLDSGNAAADENHSGAD